MHKDVCTRIFITVVIIIVENWQQPVNIIREMGDGYTGEEEAQKQGGGEDHMSRQTSSAGFSFLFESVP